MAVYIQIIKVSDNQDDVEYEFSTVDGRKGFLKITKKEGDTILIKHLPGDENGHLFARASYKIKKSWQSGEYPEKTCWAS